MKWANEILPIATEAHSKLTFHANAKIWSAKSSDLPGYDQWAREQVSLELARAGYRLAAILEKGLALTVALRAVCKNAILRTCASFPYPAARPTHRPRLGQ